MPCSTGVGTQTSRPDGVQSRVSLYQALFASCFRGQQVAQHQQEDSRDAATAAKDAVVKRVCAEPHTKHNQPVPESGSSGGKDDFQARSQPQEQLLEAQARQPAATDATRTSAGTTVRNAAAADADVLWPEVRLQPSSSGEDTGPPDCSTINSTAPSCQVFLLTLPSWEPEPARATQPAARSMPLPCPDPAATRTTAAPTAAQHAAAVNAALLPAAGHVLTNHTLPSHRRIMTSTPLPSLRHARRQMHAAGLPDLSRFTLPAAWRRSSDATPDCSRAVLHPTAAMAAVATMQAAAAARHSSFIGNYATASSHGEGCSFSGREKSLHTLWEHHSESGPMKVVDAGVACVYDDLDQAWLLSTAPSAPSSSSGDPHSPATHGLAGRQGGSTVMPRLHALQQWLAAESVHDPLHMLPHRGDFPSMIDKLPEPHTAPHVDPLCDGGSSIFANCGGGLMGAAATAHTILALAPSLSAPSTAADAVHGTCLPGRSSQTNLLPRMSNGAAGVGAAAVRHMPRSRGRCHSSASYMCAAAQSALHKRTSWSGPPRQLPGLPLPPDEICLLDLEETGTDNQLLGTAPDATLNHTLGVFQGVGRGRAASYAHCYSSCSTLLDSIVEGPEVTDADT